jgi:hypothetical protein
MQRLIGVLLLESTALSSDAAEWKLVWSDEFEKPGLPDGCKWDYESGFIRNNEKQLYTRARNENARVENGSLVIEARRERYVAPGSNTGDRSRSGSAATRDPTNAHYT